jgi:hypothetical protein
LKRNWRIFHVKKGVTGKVSIIVVGEVSEVRLIDDKLNISLDSIVSVKFGDIISDRYLQPSHAWRRCGNILRRQSGRRNTIGG